MPSLPSLILGHARQQGELLADIAKGNVAHAYLFSGPAHIGKFTIARWFAAELLTDGVAPEKKQVAKEQIDKLLHPDFLTLDKLWIEDIQDDWAEISQYSNVPQLHRSKVPKAKTDVIGIDDVRALQERLIETSTSQYTCCLIRSVERMQDAAANAFLKILEEPPAHVIFILTTQEQSALVPTIVSRTRIVRFSPLPAKEIQPLVAGLSEDDADLLLHLAGGAPGTVISLMDDPEKLREEKQLHATSKRVWLAHSAAERLEWLTTLTKDQDTLDNVLLHLGLTLREAVTINGRRKAERAYTELVRGLQTNAHKSLLLTNFALSVS